MEGEGENSTLPRWTGGPENTSLRPVALTANSSKRCLPPKGPCRGHTDLAGHFLWLRAEVLWPFPAACRKVQDGSCGHVRGLGIVCVVEAWGRGWRAGAVLGEKAFGKGLAAKSKQHHADTQLEQQMAHRCTRGRAAG